MNPFTVITKFFGINNNFSTAETGTAGSSGSMAFDYEAIPDGVGIIRSEITESNLILYKISRDAALSNGLLATSAADSDADSTPDSTVDTASGTASVDIDELKRCGLVLFINDELNTVEIKQVENVAAALVPAVPAATTEDSAETEEVPDTVEIASEAVNYDDSSDDDDADIAADEIDETELETSETSETDDETADYWTTAIVVLASSVNTQSHQFLPALYEKAIKQAAKAGRYEVLIAPEESEEQEPEAESASEEDTAAEATITVDTEDNNVEVEEAEVEDTESYVDGTDAEDTEDTEETEADAEESEENGEIGEVGDVSDLCDFIIFLIGYLLRCDVFIPNNAQSGRDAHNNSVSGNTDGNKNGKYVDLTGTELYLVSRSKGVSATGILTSGSKRILVKAGSTVSSDNRLPLQKGQTSSATLRQKLIDDGIIVDGHFASDYEFHSTSAAASVILGQSASGMNTWKDEAGRKLETLLGRAGR